MPNAAIGAPVYTGIALMILFGLLFPTAVAIRWIRTRKERVGTVLIGAATWFVFAMILETVPKAVFLNTLTPVGRAVLSRPALAVVLAALLAGIFEETGRFLAFRTVLKNRRNRETSISHGIGHGGFEAMFLLVTGGVQNLIYAILIRTGQFRSVLDAAAAQGADVSALKSLPYQIAAITPGTACLSAAERVFAMLLHAGLSILVFYAVKKRKTWLYPLAVLAHALFDVPAALYQFGVIGDLYLVEALIAVYAVVTFTVVYRTLYMPDKAAEAADG